MHPAADESASYAFGRFIRTQNPASPSLLNNLMSICKVLVLIVSYKLTLGLYAKMTVARGSMRTAEMSYRQ